MTLEEIKAELATLSEEEQVDILKHLMRLRSEREMREDSNAVKQS
jgi:hypothetical protein